MEAKAVCDKREKLARAALFVVAQQLPSLPLATSSMLHGRRQGATVATGSAHCIRHLSSFQTLRRISVTANHSGVLSLSPEQQGVLRGMRCLTELVFASSVDCDSLAELRTLPLLHSLHVVSPHGQLHLTQLTRLSMPYTYSLDITSTGLLDDTIQALATLTGLTQLRMGSVSRLPGSLDVADLVRGMTCLRHLEYRGALRYFTFEVDARHVAHLPLVHATFEGVGIAHVNAIQSLKTLELGHDGFMSVSGPSALEDLTLQNHDFHRLLDHFPFLKQLTRLCIKNTHVTDLETIIISVWLRYMEHSFDGTHVWCKA